jgi:hypothetical protein
VKDLNVNPFFVTGIVAVSLLLSALVEPVLTQNQAAYGQADYGKYILGDGKKFRDKIGKIFGSGTHKQPNNQNQEFATTIVSNTVPLDACCQGDIGIAEVSCPEGTEVTGGGYEILGGDITGRGETQPWADAPTDNGWKVAIVTAVLGEIGDDTSLTVYAVCGALVEPT